jgi:N-acetylmuramoyl-L-alanine amidase
LILVFAAAAFATLGAWHLRSQHADVRLSETLGGNAEATAVAHLRGWLLGPPRVGLQVGHWLAERHPEETASLRTSTGGYARGVEELTINLEVVTELTRRLTRAGVRVDILPAVVPPGYRADAFLSIHADSSTDPTRRGYKSAHRQPARSAREPLLLRAVDRAYLEASGLPHDLANISGGMNDYYAFASHRLQHATAPRTPSVIVELGYLSHPDDLAWMQDTERTAAALESAVLAYLMALERWVPKETSEDVRPEVRVLASEACFEPFLPC